MCATILVLLWLSCIAQARRLQTPESQQGLAKLLLTLRSMRAFNLAFNHCSLAARQGLGFSASKETGHSSSCPLRQSLVARLVVPKMSQLRGKSARSRGQGRGSESKGATNTSPRSLSNLEAAPGTPRVLIVGSGLTGSLTCYHLRALMQRNVRIDVKDMARGPGGRMSTTRYGPDEKKANTGAQYVSFFSPKAADTLEAACALNIYSSLTDNPLKRSTHFMLKPYEAYMHFLPNNGTNSVVKQFLYGGEPDEVTFQSRLQRIVVADSGSKQFLPLFDRGGMSVSAYDVIILAMPPKDILKFFSEKSGGHDPQSQADLHRRTNQGRSTVIPPGHRPVVLPPDVVRMLRRPSYIGRYSLGLWFDNSDFIDKVWTTWNDREKPHAIIDAISPQQNVIITQSTVEFWQRVVKSGGRNKARAALDAALEDLAGVKMPPVQHAKLLNWRTSQVVHPLPSEDSTGAGVVTAEDGRLIFTGDWCVESSFEGCNLAAIKAATVAQKAISVM